MTRLLSLTKTKRLSLARSVGCVSLLALLAACAGQAPVADQTQEAVRYAAHARSGYTPPGPPDDPWGPYIREAAAKFDVPDIWIRAVMGQESGGEMYQNGHLIISPVGAMGLMQVMPQTYDELRGRYPLGDDPYDPHDNVLAGTAYMREMYDMYGSPGFLAAYNAGPHRLDDYLSNQRGLPDETRHYVASIAPTIEGIYPARRSPAEAYAMNQIPIEIPRGTRYGGMVQVAEARATARHGRNEHTRLARLPEPPDPVAPPAPRVAVAFTPVAPSGSKHRGFHLIQQAVAEPAPPTHSGGWAVQVGAYGRQNDAEAAASSAKAEAHSELGVAHPVVASVHQAHATLWRARLTGLTRDSAVRACAALSRSRKGCIVLSPEAQS